MVSIKEYAESCGVSVQAVYRQLKAKKNKERLKGHIVEKEGKKWLDEEAVAILNESREKSPAIIVEEHRSEYIKSLEKQIEQYKSMVIELQQQIISNQEALLEAKRKETLLEQAEAEIQRMREEKEKRWFHKLFGK